MREYGIVDPVSRWIEAYTLDNQGQYRPIDAVDGRLPSILLPGLYIRADWLFTDPRPNVLDALADLGVR